MQFTVNFFSQLLADALNLGEVIDAGVDDTLEPAETGQQLLAPLCPDTVDTLQTGGNPGLAPPCAVPGNGKPVGLVANLLDEMQSGVVCRKGDNRVRVRQVNSSMPALRSGPLATPTR